MREIRSHGSALGRYGAIRIPIATKRHDLSPGKVDQVHPTFCNRITPTHPNNGDEWGTRPALSAWNGRSTRPRRYRT